jgi:putative Holliday junction resolvase
LSERYGRILGIDPGTKRIGFALSDDLRWTAQPLEVWKRRSVAEDVAHVIALIEAHEVIGVVVGVPYRLDGGESDSTKRAKALIEALRAKITSVPIVERDEALTTWEAEERMRERGLEPKRELIDAYAAAVILQEELDAKRDPDPAD